jgi:hypothetical protein
MVDETTAVFDHYLREFRALQRRFCPDGVGGHTPPSDLSLQVAQLSDQQAQHLSALAAARGEREVATALHEHPLHQEVILQSAILKHALEKPRGYAGDMDLMLKICQSRTGPAVAFADHLDAFYAGLPASQAVRDRVCMLARLIDDLPGGSRALNLACGPALEVQSHFRRRPGSTLSIDLVDHDLQTLRYLKGRVPSERVTLLQGNALRLMAGDLRVRRADPHAAAPGHPQLRDQVLQPGYDLIYSAGLYDYIPGAQDRRGGVTALTAVLFGLLNPGGHLLVGNYLSPSPTSRHQPHHRAIMELYCKWRLYYRDSGQILAFAAGIPGPHTVDLVDETGHRLHCAEESVIGFASIRAR